MKKSYTIILIILILFFAILALRYHRSDTDSYSGVTKIEIKKIIPGDTDIFDEQKMTTIKSWTFSDEESVKVIFNKYTIGLFEPLRPKVSGSEYDPYYLKILYDDGSFEEWILWLDKEFEKDGSAENKSNRFKYKLIDKKYVREIGKLLDQ